jgi:hypothetical protein
MDPWLLASVVYGSGIAHVLGYLLYIRCTLRGEVRPNPTTWLMWAYGTALVVLLERDQEAAAAVLLLPSLCAACSIAVAFICWRRGRLRWPERRSDQAAFLVDLLLTGVYLLIVLLAARGWISASDDTLAKTIVLLAVGGSTAVSYWPILRATRRDPDNEHWLPWAVWTAAYSLLLIATAATHGSSVYALQFWVYPLSCLVLTAAVGLYSLGVSMRRSAATTAKRQLAQRRIA